VQQLQFLKPTLLEKINGFLGEPLIEDIRFKVGNIPSARAQLKERSQEKEKKLDPKTIDRIEQLIKDITDAEVKRRFRELLIKSAKAERSRKKSGMES
jgi:hypothetical protein